MYEADLWGVSAVAWVYEADCGTGRGTNSIGEVSDQVADLDAPDFELAVQPTDVPSAV